MVAQSDLVHEECGLLAADATGAIANHGFAVELLAGLLDRGRKIAEFLQSEINRAAEPSGENFKIVAGVQHDNGTPLVVVARVEPALERVRVDRNSAAVIGPNRGVVHANDFAFDAGAKFSKRHALRPTLLHRETAEARVGA